MGERTANFKMEITWNLTISDQELTERLRDTDVLGEDSEPTPDQLQEEFDAWCDEVVENTTPEEVPGDATVTVLKL